MQFKVLKASSTGNEPTYSTIGEVLSEVGLRMDPEARGTLHAAIRQWAKTAKPGTAICTPDAVIVALFWLGLSDKAAACPFCGNEDDLNLAKRETIGDSELEQHVSCPYCNKEWLNIFTLSTRRRLS